MKKLNLETFKKLNKARKNLPRTTRETPFGSKAGPEMEAQVRALKSSPSTKPKSIPLTTVAREALIAERSLHQTPLRKNFRAEPFIPPKGLKV